MEFIGYLPREAGQRNMQVVGEDVYT